MENWLLCDVRKVTYTLQGATLELNNPGADQTAGMCTQDVQVGLCLCCLHATKSGFRETRPVLVSNRNRVLICLHALGIKDLVH